MQPIKWENGYRTMVVCIDRYDNRVPVGRLYNPFCPGGIQFHGVVEFLRKVEDLLDQMRFPQSQAVVRSFVRSASFKWEAPDEEAAHEGACGTFSLKVLFRQNASWQGSVAWLEGNKEESFRSAMELILLMDSAICAEGSGE